MPERNITPAEKTALALISLGKEAAIKILKHLNEEEVKKISKAFLTINDISEEARLKIHDELKEQLTSNNSMFVDGKSFAKDIITNSYDDNKAQEYLEIISDSNIESLKKLLTKIPERVLIPFITSEHPQTIAFLLTEMEPELASSVLKALPEEKQTDILIRISHLNTVRNEVVDDVKDVIINSLIGNNPNENEEIQGTKSAANILNFFERQNEDRILLEIEETYPSVAEQIRNLMFTFEDMTKLDDRGIQSVLKDISREQLILALKTASPELTNLIFRNMSKRVSGLIQEDLETLGPVKLKDVEQAQKSIVDVVRKLEEDGIIYVEGAGSKDQMI